MPLFMDFHKTPGVTIEDLKNAHITDLAVQDKYDVKYRQFWFNENEGTVFCLIEAPSREACEAVHREAHGFTACNVVEVETGFYNLFMGQSYKVDHGHVTNSDGSADNAFRSMMVIAIQGLTTAHSSADFPMLRPPSKAKKLVTETVLKFHGRNVDHLADDSLLAVFNTPEHGLRCIKMISDEIQWRQTNGAGEDWRLVYRAGLCVDQPVNETGTFFEEGIRKARRLCNLARENQVVVSSRFNFLCNVREILSGTDARFVLLEESEDQFISSLFNIAEANLSNGDYTVDHLSRDIGISRPQLYRKLTQLAGRSPNDFIRDMRMETALSLIKLKTQNVSEIALEVGYNSPSYFAKCFQKRFGCNPSDLVRLAAPV